MPEILFDPHRHYPRTAEEASDLLTRAALHLLHAARAPGLPYDEWHTLKEAELHLTVLADYLDHPDRIPHSDAWREYWPADLPPAEVIC